MSNFRTWVFRILVLVGAGLMLYTWFQPWWQAHIVALNVYGVTIFPYGMEVNLDGHEAWLKGADEVMPGWFTPFMWVYLGLCIIALLFSLFASSEKRIGMGKLSLSLPQALISGVGLSYVIVVISAVITIAMNAPNFYDAPLVGSITVFISQEETSTVTTALQFGYWLACGVGLFLVILSLIRNRLLAR